MAKKYSLNIENDEVVSVEVDGVQYDSPDQIPDPEDRAKILHLMARSTTDDFDQDFDKDFDKEFAADLRELERQSAQFPKIIVSIFLLIAVIMLTIATIATMSAVKRLAREQSTPGRVVDMVVRPSWDNERRISTDYYYPVVEFYLPGEVRQTVQLSEGSSPPSFQTGESVTVLYDPGHPLNARIDSVSSTVLMWILPGITGFMGVAFLGAGLFAWWFLKPAPGEQQPK